MKNANAGRFKQYKKGAVSKNELRTPGSRPAETGKAGMSGTRSGSSKSKNELVLPANKPST